MKISNYLFFFITIFCISSCSKDDDNSPVDEPLILTEIAGKIIYPVESPLNNRSLEINSSVSNKLVEDNGYSIEVAEEEHNFLFVGDKNNEVYLLGYNYPGQQNHTIDAESTVIALAMSMPIATILDSEGKVDLLNTVKADPGFKEIVAKTQELILQGLSPVSPHQKDFQNQFALFFSNMLENNINHNRTHYNKKVSLQKLSNQSSGDDPVTIYQAGKNVLFQNSGKLYNTSIGIYRNDERIKHIQLDRIKFFATSIQEAANTATNNFNERDVEIVEESYEFPGHGQYEIRINTGKEGGQTFESQEAVWHNMTTWGMDVLMTLYPLKGKAQCTRQVVNSFRTYTKAAMDGDKNINSVSDGMALTYSLTENFLSGLGGSLTCMIGNNSYSQMVEKLFSWNSLVSKIGSGVNMGIGITQWLSDDSSMELCYEYSSTGVGICTQKITVGDPFFTISSRKISHVAWTGQKLWALTDLNGNGSTYQEMMEINPNNGAIIRSFPPNQPMWTLEYANGRLWDIYDWSFDEQNYAEMYNASTGNYIGNWYYTEDYELYYYLTFDGTYYWGTVNYDCGGNCQALIAFDLDGNAVQVFDDDPSKQFEDLIFAEGFFWASTYDGFILKLDKDLNAVERYEVTNFEIFGEVQYANEIAMRLEYIHNRLWIIDRFNNFYKTSIE
ncbi:hypothetical protein RM553_17590 [Zunongwangia sp. F363]|uniref:Spi protease inhibitor domain-containing protein n=1 Tax=Autumnicola tepida TaxID=3075595 RepID=A0ABU3CE78_9FLAO|nr:hypothetical protein [Zunongwangia sp. F363]MDT0644657.1 hypothetical protein [Zunongwangia sp. F363]